MAPKAEEIIVEILKLMSQRHKLAYAATAGNYSRVLAGSIARIPKLAETVYFAFKYPPDPHCTHNDIVLARQVAETIGGSHRTIEAASDDPCPETSTVCRASEEVIATGFES